MMIIGLSVHQVFLWAVPGDVVRRGLRDGRRCVDRGARVASAVVAILTVRRADTALATHVLLARALARLGYSCSALCSRRAGALFGYAPDPACNCSSGMAHGDLDDLVRRYETACAHVCESEQPDVLLVSAHRGLVPDDGADRYNHGAAPLAMLVGCAPDVCVLLIRPGEATATVARARAYGEPCAWHDDSAGPGSLSAQVIDWLGGPE